MPGRLSARHFAFKFGGMIAVLTECLHVQLHMESDQARVRRFIQAFEDIYKRKPTLEDAEGDFKRQVAQDMRMSVGGAHYYLRLAAEHEEKEET